MDLSNGTTVQLVFDAVVIAVVIWFWARSARPTLLAQYAEPLAASAVRLVSGFAWLLIMGVGHPEYRFLRYATGSRRPGADR
jgi:hypothetical protein